MCSRVRLIGSLSLPLLSSLRCYRLETAFPPTSSADSSTPLLVGGNAVSAFLSWRLQATNACDVTLVWKNGYENVSQYGISFRYVMDTKLRDGEGLSYSNMVL